MTEGESGMYCYRCGVRLEEGSRVCPLCRTPVPETAEAEKACTYPDRQPAEEHRGRCLLAGLMTAALAAACLGCLIFCLRTLGRVDWSGVVMLSCALVWVCAVLPLFFRRFLPLVFVPVDFACLCGFLLYVCAFTGGRWFLSFAFPVAGLVGLLTTVYIVLFRNLRQGRILTLGILLMVTGASFMLVEYLLHITFATPMFVWSLYCVIVFGALGLYLLLAGLIPPLGDHLRRKFFL